MHAQTAHHLQRHDQNRNPLEPSHLKPNHLTKQTVAAQLPVGPRPPAGSGEPGAAGPSLDRWGRTWRRTVDHRPGLHHLRNLRAGEGGGARPRLHWPARLPPAAGRGRWHWRRADGQAAEGSGQHPLGARPTSCGRRWVGCAAREPEANSRCGLTAGCYTHDVVAVCRKTKVRYSITVRLHQSLRNIIEAIPEEDWTPIPYWMEGRRRCGRDQLHSLRQ